MNTEHAGENQDPKSFVEMLQRSAEHLGTLQVGKVMLCRNVIKVHVVDEHGEWVADLDIPTATLERELLERVWGIEVALAKLAVPRLSDLAADALCVFAKLGPQSGSNAERG